LNSIYLPNSSTSGAVCLDGSPGGYFIDRNTSTDWVIYFQGGGWCYEEHDCATRAQTLLGSSKLWNTTYNTTNLEGYSTILNSNTTVNPDFADFNHVFLPYCDGASFTGDADSPVVVDNTTVYFRGLRILNAVIADLKMQHGFNTAQTVVVSGCSAGGLSTYLHADYIGKQLPSSVTKFRAIPLSGFFLYHVNTEGKKVYPDQMKYAFQMQNSTGGVDEGCIASKPVDYQWECFFAQENYPFIETPIFVINSAYDSWQVPCILASEPVGQNSSSNGACGAAPGWGNCTVDLDNCNVIQDTIVQQYGDDFVTQLTSIATWNKPGNGAFIHSCYTHCDSVIANWWELITINGTSERNALHKWWISNQTTPAATNNYLPCRYPIPFKNCNPTCNELLDENSSPWFGTERG